MTLIIYSYHHNDITHQNQYSDIRVVVYCWLLLCPVSQVLDHLILIKDAKQSRVTQYVRKTLAKKRLSSEKSSEVAPGRGGDKGTTSAADRRDGHMSGPVPSSLHNYKISSHFNPFIP